MYFIHSYVSVYVDNTLGNLYNRSLCRDEEIVAVEIWSVPGCMVSRKKCKNIYIYFLITVLLGPNTS